MASIFGYILTSRQLQDGVPGMDPNLPGAAAPQGRLHRHPGAAGLAPVGYPLAGGDTLVVVAIDRIGRIWQDTVRSICELRDRGVKIRSLAEAETQWTCYLEADEGSPEAF